MSVYCWCMVLLSSWQLQHYPRCSTAYKANKAWCTELETVHVPMDCTQVCIKVCCSCCVHPGRDQHLEHAGSGHKASCSWTWGWWLRWCHCGFKSRLPIPNTMRARQYAVTSMLHEQICRSTHLSRCLVVHCAKHATQELCLNCLAHADTAIEWPSCWLPVLWKWWQL